MKSLEIVNERIEDLESRLESANYLANGNPSEFGKIFIGDLSKQLNGFKQIKADLEVLEILKEYVYVNPKSTDNVQIISMKDIFILKQCKSEELLKLKQWLEANE